MANNTVRIDLQLNSNIRNATTDARDLNRELTAAARAAQNIEYGRARGAMGATGASGRDFANQAQGLGGLVRIYATVAANAFAAISAFNALKQAADTSILIRGLDQLGASSGIALGSLAKQFVAVTDGAISFRDAAQSAAKATGAGLSSRQFLEIAKVAKNASQALGVDMTDAVNRLTRGITKLEPELLDELGIYTKIGPATEEYARTVGKTAASLTDFERRQAFANAVLEEGRQKYDALNIQTNPYQQLEAGIKDLTFAGLELINKFLIPIASVFSGSSTLLTAALAGIVVKLTQMAIPALSSWRQELVDSAARAKAVARNINESFGERFVDRINASFRVPELRNNLSVAEQEYERSRQQLLAIDQDYANRRKSVVYRTARDPAALGRMDDTQLQDLSKRVQREIAQQNRLGTQAAQLQVLALEEQKKAILGVLQARQQLTTAETSAQQAAEQGPRTFGEAMRERISRRAGARAQRLDILSQVGQNVNYGGFIFAMQQIDAGVRQATDMNRWDRWRTRVTGVLSAVGAQVGLFLRSLAGIGQVIAIAGVAIGILDSIFSENEKSLAKFTKEVELNNQTVETSQEVLKKYKDNFLSTDALQAVNTSLGELQDRVKGLTDTFQKQLTDQGPWDSIKQSILGIFNSGAQQDYANAIAQNLIQQIQSIPEGAAKATLQDKLRSILNVTEISEKTITKAIAASKDATSVVTQVQRELLPITNATRELGFNASIARDSIKNLSKTSQDLQNSFVDQSPIAKFAVAVVDTAEKIQKSFENVNSAIANFKDMLSMPAAFAFLEGLDIQKYQDVVKQQEQIQKTEQVILKLQAESAQKNTELQGLLKRTGGKVIEPGQTLTREQQSLYFGTEPILRRAGQLRADIAANQAEENRLRTISAQGAADAFSQVIINIRGSLNNAIVKAIDLVTQTSIIAKDKAKLDITKSISAGVSGPGIAQVTFQQKERELDLQLKQINLTANLADTLFENTIAVEKSNVLQQQAQLDAKSIRTPEEQFLLEQLKVTIAGFNTLNQAIKDNRTISSKEIPTLGGAGRFALQRELSTSGTQVARAGVEAAKTINQLDLEINKLREARQVRQEQQKVELAILDTRTKFINAINSSISTLTQEQLALAQIAEQEKQQFQFLTAQAAIREDILEIQTKIRQATEVEGSQSPTARGLVTALQFKERQLQVLRDSQTAETALLQIQQEQQRIQLRFTRDAEKQATEDKIQQLAVDRISAQLESEQQLLDFAMQRKTITEDEYNQSKRLLDLKSLEFNLNNQIAAKRRETSNAEAQLLKEYETARAAAGGEDLLPATEADFARRFGEIRSLGELEINNLRRINDLKMQSINLQNTLTARQKEYENIFENTFANLGDALLNWAKTGKWAGKDLFDSLINDIARYELRLQALSLWLSVRGTLMQALGFGFAGLPAGYVQAPTGTPIYNAMGNVFNKQGIQEFAKGGMFTNKVVTEPTYFKFAKGTGLMGEAGPEAIMPLKRDGQGNLGVRSTAQAPTVDIVINNNTPAQATTQQTVDSRGNRRIEVTLGDMVTGEMNRPGSSLRETMRNSYNMRPAMARR